MFKVRPPPNKNSVLSRSRASYKTKILFKGETKMNNMNKNSIITNKGEFIYKTDEEYVRRIFSVAFELKKAGVPYTDNKILDGWQLRFPWCKGDIICHFGSYSNNAGCVESMGFPWDEGDCTAHTPEEMAKNIIEYYNNKRRNNMSSDPTTINHLSYDYEADFDSVVEALNDRYYKEIEDDAKRDLFLVNNFDTLIEDNEEYLLNYFRKSAEEEAIDNFYPEEDEWDARRPV